MREDATATKERRDHPDFLDCLVKRENQQSQLTLLDQKETEECLVSMVHQEHQDETVHQVRKENLVLTDLWEVRELEVQLVNQDVVQEELLVRREKEDSMDPLARKVFLDPQEKMAWMVWTACLEPQVKTESDVKDQLVQSESPVAMDSLVKMVNPDYPEDLDHQDLWDNQDHLAETDLEEAQECQDLPELKESPVNLVLAFQD